MVMAGPGSVLLLVTYMYLAVNDIPATAPPPLVSSSLLVCRRVLPKPAPPQLINRSQPLPDKGRPQSDSTLIKQFQHQVSPKL